MAADAGAGSVMIVVVEPGVVGGGPGFFTVIRGRVCPFLGEGAVEAFHFPVGLGPVGARVPVFHVWSEGVLEGVGSVAGAVVGHDFGDADTNACEVGAGAFPERCRGFFAFVGEDLGVREPGMIVDGVVEERVPASPPAVVAGSDGAAEYAMPTPVGDPAEFLDIDVDEVSRAGALIPDRPGLPDGQPGRLIDMCEEWHPVAGEDAFDRGAGDAEVVADAVWPPPAGEPERDDAMLTPLRESPRRMVRT